MMRVLVANRGEIAVRIMRGCRELGYESVAVYSTADKESLHTRYADNSVHLGDTPAKDSYLNAEKIIQAAVDSKASAIHPGYGFLSESAAFAKKVEEAGLIFIGPSSETLALTGDKLAARKIAREAGLPVLPGPDEAIVDVIPPSLFDRMSYPVLIKAVSGGGGRGIRLANNEEELEIMVQDARREAQASFGDDTVYLEPLVQQARHIEIQILGDGDGNIICLGERECSIQRRRQKLIEEAPAPNLSSETRSKLYAAAINLAKVLKYRSLGTVEFLLDEKEDFYFIEVNPRIQVEHPVTEMVTGIDLVAAQLNLAAGKPLTLSQETITIRGSAIEVRIIAEDPENGFLPSVGEITYLKEPGGPGVRVDSALFTGIQITPDYDSLLSKIIVWAEDRHLAIRRMTRALMEYQIGGIPSDIEFLRQIIDSEIFNQGNQNTTYLDTFQPVSSADESEILEMALAAALLEHQQYEKPKNNRSFQDGGFWRYHAWKEQMR